MIAAGGIASVVSAAIPPEQGDDAPIRAAVARMQEQSAEVIRRTGRFDPRLCLDNLDPVFEMARMARPLPFYYFTALATCRYMDASTQRANAPEPEIRSWFEHWWGVARQGSSWTHMDDVGAVMSYVRLLGELGLMQEAPIYFIERVRPLMAAARASPPDTRATEQLLEISRQMLGQWRLQDTLRQLHGAYEQGLGETHRASLLLLRALAYHERFLGRPEQALSDIERASTLAREHLAEDKLLNAHMDTERAACLAANGRVAEGMRHLVAARAVFEQERPFPWISLTRIETNLAAMSLNIGDLPAAIDHADRSVEIAQASGIPVLRVEALLPAAIREVARLRLDQPGAAQALKDVIERAGPTEMHIGPYAFELAQWAARTGNSAVLAWASEFADLHIRHHRAPLQADSALRPLMQAWRESGHALAMAGARPHLERAVTIGLAGRAPGTSALTQFALARNLSDRAPEASIWLYKRGANALQRLRQGLPEDQTELVRAWLGAYEDDLREFVGLLIAQGRLPEAEHALRALRDEEVHEYTRRSSSDFAQTALSFNAAEQEVNAAAEALSRRVEAAARAADRRTDALPTASLRSAWNDAESEAAISVLQADLSRLLDASFASPAAGSARSAVAPGGGTALPAGTARLSYAVREDALDIIVQTRRHHGSVRVEIRRRELFALVHRARAALVTPQSDAGPALRELHARLIAPVLRWLSPATVTRLQVVPDAALRYVPFAALHNGHRYLVQDFDVATEWPGEVGTVTPAGQMALRGRQMLALGSTRGDEQHAALPGVQNELAVLSGVGSRVLSDDAFTVDSLREGLLRRPSLVHIASHFNLDAAGEERSYLLLGDGTRLALSALKALPWNGVQLAVLSACDTAVLVEQGHGRELLSFASALHRSGVHNVIATLWRVADGATAQWVKLLYAPFRASSGTMARPARRWVSNAQRQWIRRHAGSNLSHPHYWAGFTWSGGAR